MIAGRSFVLRYSQRRNLGVLSAAPSGLAELDITAELISSPMIIQVPRTLILW